MSLVEQISDDPDFWMVTPSPGFCVKFRDVQIGSSDHKSKLFINFCTCKELPPPADDIDEDDLAKIISSSEPGSYTIPLSVGEVSFQKDNSGQNCVSLDVIVNESYYESRIKSSELFKGFLIIVASEAIHSKHSLNIDSQNYVILRNRKVMGELKSQTIRKKPLKPLITELNEKLPKNKVIEPSYKLISKIGPSGNNIIESNFQLTGIKSEKEIELDIGEDRILLRVENMYLLDIYLPVEVKQDTVRSEFDVKTEILNVVLECK